MGKEQITYLIRLGECLMRMKRDGKKTNVSYSNKMQENVENYDRSSPEVINS